MKRWARAGEELVACRCHQPRSGAVPVPFVHGDLLFSATELREFHR